MRGSNKIVTIQLDVSTVDYRVIIPENTVNTSL